MAHVHFPALFLRSCQKEVTNNRKYLRRHYGNPAARDKVVEMPCAGGCGKTVRVKLKNMGPGNLFVCNDRDTRDQCHHEIPSAVHGLTAVKFPQSSGHFMGIQYQDLGRWSALKASCKDVLASITFPIKAGLGIVKSR